MSNIGRRIMGFSVKIQIVKTGENFPREGNKARQTLIDAISQKIRPGLFSFKMFHVI